MRRRIQNPGSSTSTKPRPPFLPGRRCSYGCMRTSSTQLGFEQATPAGRTMGAADSSTRSSVKAESEDRGPIAFWAGTLSLSFGHHVAMVEVPLVFNCGC
jgi:hypothetical protein